MLRHEYVFNSKISFKHSNYSKNQILTDLVTLLNSAFVRHKQKISDLMNDKFQEFHSGNRKAEETLKRLND